MSQSLSGSLGSDQPTVPVPVTTYDRCWVLNSEAEDLPRSHYCLPSWGVRDTDILCETLYLTIQSIFWYCPHFCVETFSLLTNKGVNVNALCNGILWIFLSTRIIRNAPTQGIMLIAMTVPGLAFLVMASINIVSPNYLPFSFRAWQFLPFILFVTFRRGIKSLAPGLRNIKFVIFQLRDRDWQNAGLDWHHDEAGIILSTLAFCGNFAAELKEGKVKGWRIFE